MKTDKVVKSIFFILIILAIKQLNAQQDTINISLSEIEQRFLENNALLLAQQLNIEEHKAITIQARLWNNPELTLSEVNFHLPSASQFEDGLPRNARQFSAEIEQLITTAGKRSKNIQLHNVATEISEFVYFDILRVLKFELRSTYYNLAMKQRNLEILDEEFSFISILLDALQIQLNNEFISLKDFLRIQALKQSISKEILELNKEINLLQSNIKTYISEDFDGYILASVEIPSTIQPLRPNLELLRTIALDNRQDIKISNKELQFSKINHSYQKALAYPDITLQAGYDRYGGIFRDFVGFGIKIDLPFFNRNQGNIKAASLQVEQSEILNKQIINKVNNEVIASYNSLRQSLEAIGLFDISFLNNYVHVMESVRTNYLNRTISLIEFLDFFESFKEMKINYVSLQNEYLQSIEELFFSIGTEINLYE